MRSGQLKITQGFIPTSEIIIKLIKEELKSRKFFNTLSSLGLDGCPYQPHVDELIMQLLGFNLESDQAYDFCYHIFETHSAQITDNTSIMHHAQLVYSKLIAERNRTSPLQQERGRACQPKR